MIHASKHKFTSYNSKKSKGRALLPLKLSNWKRQTNQPRKTEKEI